MKAEIRHQFDLTCSCFSDMYTNLNNKTKVCLHNQFVGGGREGGTRNHYPSFCFFASYPVSLCPLPQGAAHHPVKQFNHAQPIPLSIHRYRKGEEWLLQYLVKPEMKSQCCHILLYIHKLK